MNIVILDGYAANPGDMPMDELEALGNVTFYDFTEPDELVDHAREADAILLNKVLISDELMAQLPRLRYIGIQATGYNVVDIEAARRRGITVTNVPAYSTMSVAQQVFAHLLNVATHVDHYANDVRRGGWAAKRCFCYWDTPLIELDGKRMGIIGYGNIGRQVEKIANALGMEVVHASARNRESEDFRELLATSDVVTLHCPATAETTGMVDAAFIAQMKKGAILINTARGQIVNEGDVADALDKGQLSAYCADTLATEPAAADNRLTRCANAYFTPHNAWATREARARLLHVVASNLRAFVEGRRENVLN